MSKLIVKNETNHVENFDFEHFFNEIDLYNVVENDDDSIYISLYNANHQRMSIFIDKNEKTTKLVFQTFDNYGDDIDENGQITYNIDDSVGI